MYVLYSQLSDAKCVQRVVQRAMVRPVYEALNVCINWLLQPRPTRVDQRFFDGFALTNQVDQLGGRGLSTIDGVGQLDGRGSHRVQRTDD